MFEKNQILYMRFQCIDMYGCPKLLDMVYVTIIVHKVRQETKLLTCLHVLPTKKKKKKKTPEELCNYRPTGYRHACRAYI